MIELAPLFEAVADVMLLKRDNFNQADPYNGNHGDHMVEIFKLATQAAQEKAGQTLSQAMGDSAEALSLLKENGSAQVYAIGLAAFADQFAAQNVSLDELVRYVKGVLQGERAKEEEDKAHGDDRSGNVLKALVGGLANWQRVARGESDTSRIGAGYLFDLGIAYMQSKARGGSKAEIIVDAAVTVSPLNDVPYRAESGKLAIQTLLEAMQLE